jgi:hypothetical protein
MVAVKISGLPRTKAVFAEAVILDALVGYHHLEGLQIVAHRLNSGSWTLFLIDSANLEMVDSVLTQRILERFKRSASSGPTGRAARAARPDHAG